MAEILTGIILAGGKSRRMGMEKGLVDFKGQPLINYSIKVLKELCSEIIISSNSKNYDHMGYKVVPDLYTDSGPMGGIYSCLNESENEQNIILSCDMPFITTEIFKRLLAVKEDSIVCVPWHENDHYEPLCGIYLKDCLPVMEAFIAANNFKLPELFMKTKFKAEKISDIQPSLPEHYFMNINNAADLEFANQLIISQ